MPPIFLLKILYQKRKIIVVKEAQQEFLRKFAYLLILIKLTFQPQQRKKRKQKRRLLPQKSAMRFLKMQEKYIEFCKKYLFYDILTVNKQFLQLNIGKSYFSFAVNFTVGADSAEVINSVCICSHNRQCVAVRRFRKIANRDIIYSLIFER